MSFSYPPSGVDRATGLGGQPGSPTPTANIRGSSVASTFEENPDSPEIELGEQSTIKHTFKLSWDNGLLILPSVARGSVLTDSAGNVTRVLSSTLRNSKVGLSTLEIVSEGISFGIPPDEFEVEEVEFNPQLYVHPYFQAIKDYAPGGDAYDGTRILQIIDNAVNGTSLASQDENQNLFDSSTIPDSDILTAANLLLAKRRQGIDTFQLSGLKVTWTTYASLPQLMDMGSYIQDPVDGGLPPFFWSDTGEIGGNNILTYLSAINNPLFYANGFSWLRQADHQSYERTWFKLTSSWIGGPLGHWDTDIYPPGP